MLVLTEVDLLHRSADALTLAGTIDHHWDLAFIHGGAAMAASLEAAGVLISEGHRLLAASTTFVRPLRPGAVRASATMVRRGRTSSQVRVDLTAEADAAPALTTLAVFGEGSDGWHDHTAVERPADLTSDPPADVERLGAESQGYHALPFFDATDWRVAPPEVAPLRRRAWFRHLTDAGRRTRQRSALAIPADALGFAVVSAASPAGSAAYVVSLQISLQVHGDPGNGWTGIESRGVVVHQGVASGIAHLWGNDGRLLATAAQTAVLRAVT